MSVSHRLARLRRTPGMRAMLTETRLHPSQFIAPIFVRHGLSTPQAIQTMPGIFQLGLDHLIPEVESLLAIGIESVILFGIPDTKDELGSRSADEDGIVQQAIKILKQAFPSLLVIADVCFCQYTTHGHCGVMQGERLDHEATLPLLAAQGLSLAAAGADWLAPSGMIDGMVRALREALDEAHFSETAILSYAAKYQSHLYAPFGEAVGGAPKFGNRATYQMNPANAHEALREVHADLQEGADLVMVKPALFYLDVIHRVKAAYPEVPLCAYQVAGEYALIKQAGQQRCFDEHVLIRESLLAIRRAGADLVITYFAKQLAEVLVQ